MSDDYSLQVKNILKIYPVKKSDSINAVNNISFNAHRGEIIGLLGPNGAGKTTIVKMICSLIRPNSGKILINGIDNFKNRRKTLKMISAVLEGNRNVYWKLTVRENLEFFAALKGNNPRKLKKQMQYYINIFDLEEKQNEVVSNLSRGMQQKVAIAAALINQGEITLLDEPTLGLDVKASYDIRNLLKKIAHDENRTIIITTHDMNVVQDICERVIIIDKGRLIVDDKIENLIKLFNTKSYKFVINGSLSSKQKNELSKVSHIDLTELELATEIAVSMENSMKIYDIIHILESEQSIIEAIENKELNFEKIYMDILERGGENV